MALNDDCQVEFHLKTEKTLELRDVQVEFEADSFDFGDRFDMDFEVGF